MALVRSVHTPLSDPRVQVQVHINGDTEQLYQLRGGCNKGFVVQYSDDAGDYERQKP